MLNTKHSGTLASGYFCVHDERPVYTGRCASRSKQREHRLTKPFNNVAKAHGKEYANRGTAVDIL